MSGRLSKLRRPRGSQPAPAPAAADAGLPADATPVDPDARMGFRDRGRYRRRLRYLRRVRELGFRDLGGLTFDLHRFGRSGDDLVKAKLQALDAVDRELRSLERVLGDERSFTDLREAGIAACARCGALHGSDAHFCPACGAALTGPTALGHLPAAATAPAPATAPVAAPADPPAPRADAHEQPTVVVPAADPVPAEDQDGS